MEQAENKTIEESMTEAEAMAKNYFKQGLNCAECVMRTFLDTHDTGFSEEIMALSTGFGGGMGRTRNTCGAITGAVLALGTLKGRKNAFEKETPAERTKDLVTIYEPFADLINEIKDTYGTLICSELSAPHGDFECKSRKKNCQQIIGHCAALAAKYAMPPADEK